MRYRRKAIEVIATQLTVIQSHPSVSTSIVDWVGDNCDIPVSANYINTDFGTVEIQFGDWVVEIDGKIKVLKDEYFKEHYEEIAEKVQRPKLVIVADCD